MSTELCEIRDKGIEPNVEVADVVVPVEVANEEVEVANEVVSEEHIEKSPASQVIDKKKKKN